MDPKLLPSVFSVDQNAPLSWNDESTIGWSQRGIFGWVFIGR